MQKDVQHYKKSVFKIGNVQMTFNSENNEIELSIERTLNMGAYIGTDRISFHPSYIQPIRELLEEIEAPSSMKKGEE